MERGSAQRSSLKGRERDIVNQTNIGTVSKTTLAKKCDACCARFSCLEILFVCFVLFCSKLCKIYVMANCVTSLSRAESAVFFEIF